jgi:class 3 adenylate cyclase
MSSVLAAHKHPGFNVHVGVHTGAVLLAGGVDADGSIRGIAVNIAARMEQTAPAGALRISHDTYAQARGLFEVDAQERQRASIDTIANALAITRPTVGQVSSAETSNP